MDQRALNQWLDREDICSELLNIAERELGGFVRAVTELFGAEEAEVSAEEWLHELETSRTLPRTTREWRQVTMKVIAQLAERAGQALAIPTNVRLHATNFQGGENSCVFS